MGVVVLGSINLDNVCRVPRIPVAGETLIADSLERFAGGKGANQAVAAAAWGSESTLIGAVGQDEAGDFLLSHLQRHGVGVGPVARVCGAASGQAHICVSPAGENMIVVIGGANRAVTAAHSLEVDLSTTDIVLSQLETPLEAVEALLVRAASSGARTILNAAPAIPAAAGLLRLADIIVVNQGEMAFYADAAEPAGADDAAALARTLLARPNQAVIVTLGAAGAVLVTGQGDTVAAGRPARVVDTAGAGDCFCGVLAASLAEGASLVEAMTWANAAAALSTEQHGAAVSPTLRTDTRSRMEGALIRGTIG